MKTSAIAETLPPPSPWTPAMSLAPTLRPGPMQVAKICTCCRREFTRAQWLALPSRREWPGESFEIAECPQCLSTISVEVE